MTHKHFNAIAADLNREINHHRALRDRFTAVDAFDDVIEQTGAIDALYDTALLLSCTLSQFNSQFDRERFVHAATAEAR